AARTGVLEVIAEFGPAQAERNSALYFVPAPSEEGSHLGPDFERVELVVDVKGNGEGTAGVAPAPDRSHHASHRQVRRHSAEKVNARSARARLHGAQRASRRGDVGVGAVESRARGAKPTVSERERFGASLELEADQVAIAILAAPARPREAG